MDVQCVTSKSSVCMPIVPWLRHSDNQIELKQSRLLSFPLSGFHHNANSMVLLTIRQNTTRFQCQCTNKENLADIKTFEGDLGPWKQFVPKLLTQTFNRMFPILEFLSLKREPRNVSFDKLVGVDDIIRPFRHILKRLQGSDEHTRRNVKLPFGILIHGPEGTGKSSLVHAFAREAKLPFFVVQGTEIEKNPSVIISLFSEARISSPSIICVEGLEAVTSTGVSQILGKLQRCKKDGEVVLFIGTVHDEEKLVDGIEKKFMLVHLGKPDLESRIEMVRSLMKKHVLLEDEDMICRCIASATSGMVWEEIVGICNECCAHGIEEERESAVGVSSWVTLDEVKESLEHNKSAQSRFKKKDSTQKEDGTVVGISKLGNIQ